MSNSDINFTIDKRIDFIHALVCSYVIKNNFKNQDDFDWVEFPDTKYFHALINKIDWGKYPELEWYLLCIKGCDAYNQLAYLFDEDFNIKYEDIKKVRNPFNNLELRPFLELVRKIYLSFDMSKVIDENSSELKAQQEAIETLPINYNSSYVKNFFGKNDNMKFHIVGSIFINGGFSSTIGDDLYCTRMIKFAENHFFINKRYNFISINHEFAHHYVNPVVDKYFRIVSDNPYIYEEALANGLPKTYGNFKTVLYEYFVRAVSIVLSEKWLSIEEMQPDIDWFKEIGFVRIEEIIEIIKAKRQNYVSFEELYVKEFIPYLKNLHQNHTYSPK